MRIRTWVYPVVDFDRFVLGLREYRRYWKSWQEYEKMPGAEFLDPADAYPCLYDRTSTTGIDAHYFYQGVWAMRKIKESGVEEHVDVGSLVSFVGLLSTIVKVTFIDIRPTPVKLEHFDSRTGSVLEMPFADNSIHSLSCLHVAEHIGLGRYGDPLDPHGTTKAIRELVRVLDLGGILYFSLPIGKSRVCYNAHRIHSPQQIVDYFHELRLVEFSAVDDDGVFRQDAEPGDFIDASYACGMFCFTKEKM